MRDLSCRTARIWLQAPDELPSADFDHLQSHVATCNTCHAYRVDSQGLDVVIRQSLASQASNLSVRAAVRERLDSSRVTPLRPSLGRRIAAAFDPRLLLAPVAMALVIVLVAFLYPQSTGDRTANNSTLAATWNPVHIEISFPLTVDPMHSNHLLSGALGQVYQSWDAGASWHPLATIGPSQSIMDLAIDAQDSRHFLIATKHSILVSHDGGTHWTTAASNLLGARNMFVLQDPRNPATFYVGPSDLWKSVDGGNTWQSAGNSSIFSPWGIQTLAFGPRGRLYTGVWGGGVGVSTNGGATWQRRSRGLAPHVMTVAVGPGRLLAATDAGVYRSTNEGASWHRSGPGPSFFTTSVYDGGTFQLAGGNGGIFRSSDGGQHWLVSGNGLPLYSYIYGFTGDPRHLTRVYASLDGAGIFRSNDGGLHWQSMNVGLPINGHESVGSMVLFGRHGTLWHTDEHGTDPGALTVGVAVKRALVSPDGTAVAYIAGNSGAWSLQVVGAGGSAATTTLQGSGTLPRQLAWSPDSLRLAVVQPGQVHVIDLSGHQFPWAIGPNARFLAWSPDRSSLLFWSSGTHHVVSRAWKTGAVVERWVGQYTTQPLIAPNGTGIATLNGQSLEIGTWTRSPVGTATLPTGCTLRGWADIGDAVLAACPRQAVIANLVNRSVTMTGLPRTSTWVPGSNSSLLFFRHGSLWRWSAHTPARVIVAHADPIPSSR